MSNNPEVSLQCEPKVLNFSNNGLLPALYGRHDQHLARLEEVLEVRIACRGNLLEISGKIAAQKIAQKALQDLYSRLKDGLDIGLGDVDGAIRMAQDGFAEISSQNSKSVTIQTRKGKIVSRSPNQERYIKILEKNDLVFALGPAGTGKTYLAVAVAVSHLLRGEINRIILSRPAVEAGERLGFLPGDLKDKVDPYLRPLYDALYDMLPIDTVFRRLDKGEIEVAPLAFMRGRTLSNAFIIVDEAQNTTPMQMKMVLTRLGENARMVVTGDLSQVDLKPGQISGLREASQIMRSVKGVAFVEFTSKDVVRNPLVTRMVRAYESIEHQSNIAEMNLSGGEEDDPGRCRAVRNHRPGHRKAPPPVLATRRYRLCYGRTTKASLQADFCRFAQDGH